MKKKAQLTAAFISVFLLLAVAGAQLFSLGRANPYIREWKKEGEGPPPDGTIPPVISIINPENYTSYPSNNFLLNFNATIEKSNNIPLGLSELYYIASWQKDRTDISLWVNNHTPSTFSINITKVPEGPRWLEVYAIATAFAYETRHEIKDNLYYITYYVGYKMTSSSRVEFTIDTTAPSILSLSVENKTYTTSDVPLTLTTNEPVSQASYSLDGKENVTIAGNTTLTGLTNGDHNLTIYAKDEAGNIGTSETSYFSVEVPFPTAIVATASGASVAIIGIGLIVYLRKRKH